MYAQPLGTDRPPIGIDDVLSGVAPRAVIPGVCYRRLAYAVLEVAVADAERPTRCPWHLAPDASPYERGWWSKVQGAWRTHLEALAFLGTVNRALAWWCDLAGVSADRVHQRYAAAYEAALAQERAGGRRPAAAERLDRAPDPDVTVTSVPYCRP